MAERSFKKEVEQLKLGNGEEFRGEAILCVTKALLQSGVSYVSGYQGAPISHLIDVLNDAEPMLKELGVRFESSANEAAAAAALATSVSYPLRGACTFKAPVGTNVASDALANLSSGGVKGGALIIVGEDYGEGSSIMQERSHAFAMKSQMWLLDPRPNVQTIVDMVEKGFQLSETSNTAVMLQLRIRACHVYGSFIAKDNVRPDYTRMDALKNPPLCSSSWTTRSTSSSRVKSPTSESSCRAACTTIHCARWRSSVWPTSTATAGSRSMC
jgi:indolepyruvate ferredoxin oxidoreductase alpha subunit